MNLDFGITQLENLGWCNIIEKNDDIVDKVEIKTPDGLIILDRKKTNSKLFDDLLKVSARGEADKAVTLLFQQTMYLIANEDFDKETFMVKHDSISKLRLIMATKALVTQTGDIDF